MLPSGIRGLLSQALVCLDSLFPSLAFGRRGLWVLCVLQTPPPPQEGCTLITPVSTSLQACPRALSFLWTLSCRFPCGLCSDLGHPHGRSPARVPVSPSASVLARGGPSPAVGRMNGCPSAQSPEQAPSPLGTRYETISFFSEENGPDIYSEGAVIILGGRVGALSTWGA